MFLYGMRMMSASLKQESTGAFKIIMSKLTDSLLKSFLLGIIMTALIQSSTATIVITSGLVAANIIPFRQSLGIIIGANIGTTVTGQIIRLMDLNNTSIAWLQFFKPANLAPIALIIGIIIIMFLKFKKSEIVGSIFVGFGILFTGLLNMTAAVAELNSSGVFESLFVHLDDSPMLGYLIGTLVSFILQSSSATVGILQAFSTSGLLYFKSIYSVLLGIYLGDCTTTAIVCSIGASDDAKRVGVVNILYNLAETVIVLLGVNILKMVGMLDGIWNLTADSSLIANTNTIFNSFCALIILPFVGFLEKASYLIIKDTNNNHNKYKDLITGLDPKFLNSPYIALNACYTALCTSFEIAYNNIQRSFQLVEKYDKKLLKEIEKEENEIDELTDAISSYLVLLSKNITADELSAIINQYFTINTEFERLGDHACNISEIAEDLNNQNVLFSDIAIKEIKIMHELINNVLAYTKVSFEKRNVEAANHIEPLEEVVDDMVSTLKENHIDRLKKGQCNVVGGTNFLNLLSNIERISDVCSNVGIATILRVNPELAQSSHEYVSSLHRKEDNEFHKEYSEAHQLYFGKLKQIFNIKDNIH